MNNTREMTMAETIAENVIRVRVGIGFGEQWPARSWPGCYPLEYITDDGELLCAACMNDETNPVHFTGDRDGWRVDAVDSSANSDHETEERCAHCSALICEADDA